MIEVRKTDTSLTVTGHANYAPKGEDIVCAGVSALVSTLELSLLDLAMSKIECDWTDSGCMFVWNYLNEDEELLIDSCVLGIEAIAETYPGYVRMIID